MILASNSGLSITSETIPTTANTRRRGLPQVEEGMTIGSVPICVPVTHCTMFDVILLSFKTIPLKVPELIFYSWSLQHYSLFKLLKYTVLDLGEANSVKRSFAQKSNFEKFIFREKNQVKVPLQYRCHLNSPRIYFSRSLKTKIDVLYILMALCAPDSVSA
jgi:hypothetical protein